MIFYDKILGTGWEDVVEPEPGYARYQYPKDTYPFELGSPAEWFIWSWSQGAASNLHGHEMWCNIVDKDEKIDVLSKDEKSWVDVPEGGLI